VRKRGRTLMVDLTNLYYDIKRKYPGYSKEQYVHYLYYLICKVAEDNDISNIIICQQNHFLKKDSYRAVDDFFQKCRYISTNKVTFLTGHNKSSEDDLYIILCIEECIRTGKTDFFILTQDGYRDFYYDDPKDNSVKSIYDILGPKTRINFGSYRDRYDFIRYIAVVYPKRNSQNRYTGGGTKKNKKSLLKKYTRKPKYTRKNKYTIKPKYTRKMKHYIKSKKSHKKQKR